MLLPYLVLEQPIRLEKLDLGASRQPPAEYMSLAPQETLCSSQEFLLGLSLLINYYESSTWHFDRWHLALAEAHDLASGEMK